MDAKILSFIQKHRISCLSVAMTDETVHGATIHYSHIEEPKLQFFFNTKKESRKAEPSGKKSYAHSAVVIGFSEEEWVELQMSGDVRTLTDKEEIEIAKQTHFTKYPTYKKYEDDPQRVFLCFTPKWWRYTEFKAEPRVTIENQ
jgi:general stress protein 26